MFRNNDKSLHFHTGLENFSKFTFVLKFLGPAEHELNYSYGQVTKPCVEDQFFIVLMKLRQKKTNFELGSSLEFKKHKSVMYFFLGGG